MRRAFSLSRGLPLALVVLGVAASPSLAARPANDARAAAGSLSPPGGVSGTTAESTLEVEEAATVNGAAVTGSVWYTFRTPQARRVVLRFAAGGDLDAGVEVYRRARSQLPLEQSQLTGENGRADFIFDSRAGATYFVRVAQRANSAPGGFRLDVYLPRLFPSVPGPRLPKAGLTVVSTGSRMRQTPTARSCVPASPTGSISPTSPRAGSCCRCSRRERPRSRTTRRSGAGAATCCSHPVSIRAAATPSSSRPRG